MNCNNIRIFLVTLLIAIFCFRSSYADELQEKFLDWSVFKSKRSDKTICYLASTPIKSDGNYAKRGEPYFLVTDIVNDADEISVALGFFYKRKSDVELSFGAKKFYLFPYLNLAWANSKNEDIDIIKQMQASEEMIVSGISEDGKIANDTYSLIGFVQAYAKMKEACVNEL
ncbi:MAG: hypothetical protein KGQ36_06765 [Rickettsiales bacterium]|nr:hypothetical protein [Rickettsiales bacterium]